MDKLLIICGPTATGKTSFGIEMAKKFDGELISADSRQVYIGMDIVTGKDIPPEFIKKPSALIWHDRPLSYYTDGNVRIWLTDIVRPDEPFNVSFWKKCTGLVITDILSRHKLPIVVGGTGLYIRALTENLSLISVPHNPVLRKKLAKYSVVELFDYLKSKDSRKADSLNASDKQNPRRLLRAIEIAASGEGQGVRYEKNGENLLIGLTAPREFLKQRISDRVASRLSRGAGEEAGRLIAQFSLDLPSMTACGYQTFTKADPITAWTIAERQYLKRQLTWFAKTPGVHWFDVSRPAWSSQAEKTVLSWYNNINAKPA